jgi:hypothetical protein
MDGGDSSEIVILHTRLRGVTSQMTSVYISTTLRTAMSEGISHHARLNK